MPSRSFLDVEFASLMVILVAITSPRAMQYQLVFRGKHRTRRANGSAGSVYNVAGAHT
jgi:hypothetical protein